MRYALLLALIGFALVYFLGPVGPPSWSDFTSPGTGGSTSLGRSIGSTFEHAADLF